MKSNFKKILSIMLSICLLLSISFVSASMTVAAAEKVTDYYVGYGGTGDGSSLENMAPTVAKAINTINSNGLVAGDTANIWIVQDITAIERKSESSPTHNLAAWGGKVSHTAKIVVKPLSSNQSKNKDIPTYLAMATKVGAIDQLIIGGPTEIDGLELIHCANEFGFEYRYVITANGFDLTIGSNVTYSVFSYNRTTGVNWTGSTWNANDKVFSDLVVKDNFPITTIDDEGGDTPEEAAVFEKPFTLTLCKDVSFAGHAFDLSGFNPGYVTFKEDVNFVYNTDSYRPYVRLGTAKDGVGVVTYEKNLNVKLPVATKIAFKAGARKVVVKGGLQLITNDNVLNGFSKNDYPFTNFVANSYTDDTFTTNSDYWILQTAEADTKNIDFINGETGKFEIAINYIATATNVSTGATKDSENGVLDLSDAPGEYTVTFTYSKVEEETHNYDDLINYRGYNSDLTKFNGALANTCKKLTTKEEVNVVYMGGSLLNESDDASLKSQINTWLNNNFAKSTTINFVDKTLKDNGTTFGALRVARDVVCKLPDLVFIEYSIDDNLQGVSAEKSATQLETIVREIKSAYPNSDIVVLITSNAQGLAQDVICEKYDISTINIGTNKAEYFDIIKEFLVNTLLFGESQDTYRITDQELPQIASKIILNGNTSFIYPVDVDITTAGGTVYDDAAKGLIIPDYVGVITSPAASKDTLTFSFEGTELYILSCEGYEKQNTYKISVDGKEFETKNYSGNILTKAVEGISSGKHTVVIEPSVNANAGICGFYSRDLENCENNLTICDLVAIDENITDNGFDYSNDDAIDNKDISALKKILLGDWMKPELNSTKHIKPIARLGWRPYTGNLPEQSLISYQKAYDTGHRILLCDIRTTSDGYMVCCHDDDISKVHAYYPNGTAVGKNEVLISETTLADLLTYDFGKYKGYDGLEILQIEDFLEYCKDLGDVTPVLEMKVDVSDEKLAELVSLIKKYGFEDSIMFVCTDQRFATALPNCTMGDWVYTLTDNVIARMDALTCKGKFVYVARDGGNEDSVNFENYVKCKAKGIDLAITYIPSTYKDYFNGLKDKGIFNYCKYIALDEVSWLYE